MCALESVSYTDDGMEALIFTAEGDMRNALNNLQATCSGFGHVNQINVFKVCDQPHPTVVKKIISSALEGDTAESCKFLNALWATGYSTSDIIGTLFKVAKNSEIAEGVKLAFLREIGFCHMRIAEGSTSKLQLLGVS